MLRRCYSEKKQQKQPSYIGITVCEEWYNYQNFAKWFEENWKPWMDSNWHLDKDILVKDNKIYSPDTCCFVPREINNLFKKSNSGKTKNLIGIDIKNDKFQSRFCTSKGRICKNFNTFEEAFNYYKINKEYKLKELADKWKDKIDPIVYDTLYNYQIEITD